MMKKRFLTTVLFILSTITFLMAQVPERMTYQAVLRDAQNHLVTNRQVGMQISILHNSPNGMAVYVERQTVTSNAHGLVTVEIGMGNVVLGSIAAIQWGNGTYYIQTEVDLNGGTLYTLTGANQILTVPYAFHAKTAETLTNPTAETDPVFTAWNYDYRNLQHAPTNVSAFINDIPYLTSFSETDSIFSVSVAAGITSADTFYWNHLLDSVSLTETQNLDSVLILGNDAGAKQIKNLQDPTDPQDAVTKSYVTLRVSHTDDTLYLGSSQWVLIPGISAAMYPPPTVLTTTVSSILDTSAISGGNVIVQGYDAVISCGVCWSTSPNPTITNTHTVDGSGLGAFTSSITGLTANTTYYVRAYATNSIVTAYGNAISFTTLPPPCSPGVTDIDGNHYDGIEIGTQCWMKQNLRVTQYANGTSIPLGSSTSSSTPYRYNPNDDASNVSAYGYLYNWPAAMNGAGSSSSNPSGVQGVCPDGWHLPSNDEWTQLKNYVSSQFSYLCNADASYIGKALASTSGWNIDGGTCTVGNTPSANNATGFTALPAGGYSGSYYNFGNRAQLWSATETAGIYAFHRYLSCYDATGVNLSTDYGKYGGYSVRCLRN